MKRRVFLGVGLISVGVFIWLGFGAKLPAEMVVLSWDYEKIISWMSREFEEDGYDHMGPRANGSTLLHDIAYYRKYFSEKDTDYEKIKKLISYYAARGKDLNLRNDNGEIAYEIALKYDIRIANMIKEAMGGAK